MKSIRLGIAMLALWVTAMGHASAAAPPVCVPYKIPIASTIEACGPGLIGTKFKTKSKECPSGKLTESSEFDTSGCSTAAPRPGTVNTANKCLVTPDACAPAVTTSNCQPDEHWTLAGSGIAHCVKNDPVCPWGTSLTHDFLGNPSCEANTCSGGQVLQGDGKSCACPANMVLNGGSCVPQTPSCYEGVESRSLACAAGYTGEIVQERETFCPSGPYGGSTTGSWQTVSSTCTQAAPPPTETPPPTTCTPGSTAEYADCASGSGTMWRYHTTSCPSGSTGSPSTTVGSWNTSSCSAPASPPPPTEVPPPTSSCTESSTVSTKSCGPGFSGFIKTTTTKLCPTGSTTQEENSCQPLTCSNGASNYPTCTLECANGASDYPTCTPKCANGATDYPVCSPVSEPCKETETSVSQSCGSGYVGTRDVVTTKLCPSGTSTRTVDNCSCANGGTNYPTCTPPCEEKYSSSTFSCGGGFTGTKTIVTTQLCPTGTKTDTIDNCGCSNGASDYPTCTPPAPPPRSCGQWVKTGPFGKTMCWSATMDWEETYERTCSDGTVETRSQMVNRGPCEGWIPEGER